MSTTRSETFSPSNAPPRVAGGGVALRELDVVRSRVPVKDTLGDGGTAPAGSLGTVMHLLDGGRVVELEFVSDDGDFIAYGNASADDLELVERPTT